MDNLSQYAGSGGVQQPLTEQEFSQKLDHLAGQWRSCEGRGLELRHQTGELLNRQFGNPDQRQKRGKGVLEDAGKRLRVAVSELSRMRRFAFHFKSFADFEGMHPEVTSWAVVKRLLPTLKPNRREGQTDGGGAAASPRAGKLVGAQAVKRSLEVLSSKLRRVRKSFPDKEKRELLEKFEDVARAIENCLGVKVSVDKVSAGPTPPAAPGGMVVV